MNTKITAILLSMVLPCVVGASPDKPNSIRARLVGVTWARHLDDMKLLADGTCISHSRERDEPTHGTWRLDDHTLTIKEGRETTKYRIIKVTDTDLDMTFGNGEEGLHYRRSSD